MVFKIRVIFDSKEDVFRDIEIRDKQTLWNLHQAIQQAFSLPPDELSLFNAFNDNGEILKTIPLEDMSDDGDGETMADIYIDEIFQDLGDKLQFQYGMLDLWEFFCEYTGEVTEKATAKYPQTIYRFGVLPLKPPVKDNAISAVPLDDLGMDLDLDDDIVLEDEFDSVDDYDNLDSSMDDQY